MSKISVIGAGAWGTTLSILLAEKGHTVNLWAFEKDVAQAIKETRENKTFLPGFQLPENIQPLTDIHQLPLSEIYFFVVPSQFLRSVAKNARQTINPGSIVVSASKGIENKTLNLPLDILKQELKNKKFAVLSGPNLSAEIAKGYPAAAVTASDEIRTALLVQDALMLERFRVYTNADPLGVQLGGALKNIIAIAAGIADGLELGNNAKAGLMIRGIAEITRLGIAMGARTETFAGLAGMGDLITTCSSKLSRNHHVGEQIAKGQKLPEILKGTKEIAEGIPTTKAAHELGKKHQVSLPITNEVFQVLFKNKNPQQAILDLTTRSATSE
ncbi:NAD(P)H-dependent glycerol-3-phosphate dehydrogenase [Candidatus Margulisiibacteriota bacterium]